MRTPSAWKTKPTGSAASWGMVNGLTRDIADLKGAARLKILDRGKPGGVGFAGLG